MDRTVKSPRSSAAWTFVKYWGPVIAMIGATYSFSGDAFSDANTRSVLTRILRAILWGPAEEAIPTINFLVRKSAHVLEYALLAALLFRAFRSDSPIRFRFSWAAYSFVVVVFWSLIDEILQTRTRLRTGSIYDAILDTAGGLLALTAIAVFVKRTAARPGPPSRGGRVERRVDR